ncbi:NPCBM/NEW2 domain-containing protein [Rhodopirellula sp. JC740]|uniref:NPCBM/NEW2 domain-containing protein n=1 Tax=Rhodopirellula halodulae TaxID=2894198 RepID=A0ABS8NH31_9BACT|nr:NPCBM/NEW2 domain-containing protein [Rhodopirellula sp. JC740]MCC9642869.1 NPCBM/NEW2 domain-containing protein [Rhodopirellula sp. JC740]
MQSSCRLVLIFAALAAFCGTPRLVAQATADVRTQASSSAVTAARKLISQSIQTDRIDSPGRVVVVYFTPQGRLPAAKHVGRIRRIVEETAKFYESELKRHGFPNRSMHVLRDARGQVEVIDVVGHESDYHSPDGQRIRDEVIPVLRQRGIDADASVLLLFCNLMDYDPVASKISHHSPYYGGGTHLSGTAWQCDSEILDPKRFRDATPLTDAEYGRITIGRHNSIFIGGVIHELGHALSLPHCRQRPDEAQRGTALMGSGNRTYAQQLRGEGKDTFLTQAHAFRLAAHPVFNRQVPKSVHQRVSTDFEQLSVSASDSNSIQVSGVVRSNIPTHAVIAYFDPDGGGDYDATTASTVPSIQGRFAFRSGPLGTNVSGELRIVACHVNGTTSSRSVRYDIDREGRPDLSIARMELQLQPMIDALRTDDLALAEARLQEIAGEDAGLINIGRKVLDRFQSASSTDSPRPLSVAAKDVAGDVSSMPLSVLLPKQAEVGWLQPTYDSVPAKERLLSLGGDYFARGIYAHAPAKHVYELDRQWKRLKGQCGVQGDRFGQVDFQILGDGQPLWTAKRVTAGHGKTFDVDVSMVKVLTLKVTDGGNGLGGDWGVWIEPTLTR